MKEPASLPIFVVVSCQSSVVSCERRARVLCTTCQPVVNRLLTGCSLGRDSDSFCSGKVGQASCLSLSGAGRRGRQARCLSYFAGTRACLVRILAFWRLGVAPAVSEEGTGRQ